MSATVVGVVVVVWGLVFMNGFVLGEDVYDGLMGLGETPSPNPLTVKLTLIEGADAKGAGPFSLLPSSTFISVFFCLYFILFQWCSVFGWDSSRIPFPSGRRIGCRQLACSFAGVCRWVSFFHCI